MDQFHEKLSPSLRIIIVLVIVGIYSFGVSLQEKVEETICGASSGSKCYSNLASLNHLLSASLLGRNSELCVGKDLLEQRSRASSSSEARLVRSSATIKRDLGKNKNKEPPLGLSRLVARQW